MSRTTQYTHTDIMVTTTLQTAENCYVCLSLFTYTATMCI